MGDVGDRTISNKKREYPAWGYLLVGAVFTSFGVWAVTAGTFEDSRKPFLPWVMAVVGLLGVGYGVREWLRNGSPTARRLKSEQERRQDAETNRRLKTWRAARYAVTAVVLVLAVAALLT